MLSLFFVPEVLSPQTIVTGEEANHIHKVLRMAVGDELLLADGRGTWGSGTITSLSKTEVLVHLTETGTQATSQPRISVIQALPKSDRVKETIELLTEAGVDRIIPWQATRSISKMQGDSLSKWRQGAFTAAKQSRRFRIPDIEFSYSAATSSDEIFRNSVILTCHESASAKLSQVFSSPLPEGLEEIFVVIGPEGGLTEEEVAHFHALGAHTVRLGEPIFRSAHAGVAVLSAIQALTGRW